MYDYLIKDGKIIDGTGKSGYCGSVGISNGKIEMLRHNESCLAETVIDADGLCVAPGFIDMHTHTELVYYEHPDTLFKVSQGVTTELGGQCAISAAPVSDKTRDDIRAVNNPLCGLGNLDYPWSSFREYMDCISKKPHINNIAQLVGHNAIRSMAMGFENRPPTEAELEAMKMHLQEALDSGAFGMSIAGVQSPSNFAAEEEYIALAEVVAKAGGLFEGHMRSESNALLGSIGEMISIARKSGARTQISHLKIAGQQNYYKTDAALAQITEARQNGLDVACDQYPYTYASFNLEALLPLWARSGSKEEAFARLREPAVRQRIEKNMKEGMPETGWESVYQWCGYDGITIASVKTEKNRQLTGCTISEISKIQGKPCIDVVCDLILDEGYGVLMLLEFGREEDIEEILKYPWSSPVTDALATHLNGGGCHPRIFGTFPKVLGHYARERQLITMEEAVRKMTSLPAQRIGLLSRGMLRSGYAADIVLFDESKVIDAATLETPASLADGIAEVFVNGLPVYKEKKITGNLPGQYLKR